MARITGFDVNTAPDQGEGGGDVLPEGEYVIALLKTDFRINDKTHVVYLVCHAEVLSREWARKKLKFDIPFKLEDGYLDDTLSPGMLTHLNIGRGQLKAMVQLSIPGEHAFTDTTQLHGKPIGVKLSIRDQQFDAHGKPYPAQNNVDRVINPNDATATPPAGTQVERKAAAAPVSRAAPATPWSAPAPAAAPVAPPVQQPVAAPQFAQATQAPAPAQQASQQPVDQPQAPAAWAPVPTAPAAGGFVVPGPAAAPAPAPAADTPPWLRG